MYVTAHSRHVGCRGNFYGPQCRWSQVRELAFKRSITSAGIFYKSCPLKNVAVTYRIAHVYKSPLRRGDVAT